MLIMAFGDYLSPLFFNIIMDELIKQVIKLRKYNIGNKQIRILCYGDHALKIAENENDL